MDNSINLDEVVPVEQARTVLQNFDIRYSVSGESFVVSDEFYERHNMKENGFKLHTYKEKLLVSILPADEAVFFTGDKMKRFSYAILVNKLRARDIISNEASNVDFTLEPAGQKDGITYYLLEVMQEEKEEATEIYDEASEQQVPESVTEEETHDQLVDLEN